MTGIKLGEMARTSLILMIAVGAVLLTAAPLAVADDAAEGITVLDPDTGESVLASSVDPGRWISVRNDQLTGRLTRPDDSPLAGTSVVLLDVNTGETIKQTTTDENGNYTLTDLPDGGGLLVAGEPGFAALVNTDEAAENSSLNFLVPDTLSHQSVSTDEEPTNSEPVLGQTNESDGDEILVTYQVMSSGETLTGEAEDPSPIGPGPF